MLSLSHEGEKACSGTVPVEALVDGEAKVNQMYWMGHAALLLAEVIPGFCFELVYYLHAHTGVNFKGKQGSVLCRCERSYFAQFGMIPKGEKKNCKERGKKISQKKHRNQYFPYRVTGKFVLRSISYSPPSHNLPSSEPVNHEQHIEPQFC